MLSLLVEPSNSKITQRERGVRGDIVVFSDIFVFSSGLFRSLYVPAGPCVCLNSGGFFHALLPVKTASFKQPDSPDRIESFPRLPAASPFPPSACDTLMAAKWFSFAEMHHSTSFTLSYQRSLELRVIFLKQKHARIKHTFFSFLQQQHHKNNISQSASCFSLTLEQTDCYLSHALFILYSKTTYFFLLL